MKAETKSSRNIWQLILSIFCFWLLALLIGNITAILFAINLNKHTCTEAAQAAAAACATGGTQREIAAAVVRTINDTDFHTFFINPPELGELRFFIKADKGAHKQMLLVKTTTGVLIPAPFLLFITSPERNGYIRFSSSCVIKLKDLRLSSSLLLPSF